MDPQNKNIQALKKLREKSENKVCMDCTTKNPDWCSVNNGVFICLNCAGIHRSLGVEISFVKSAVYDKWSDEQAQMMLCGGNRKAREYFQSKGIDKLSIQQKYNSKVAREYSNQLKQQATKSFDKKPSLSVSSQQEDVEEQVRSAPSVMKSNNDWDFEQEIVKEVQQEEHKYKIVTSNDKTKVYKPKHSSTSSNNNTNSPINKDIFSQDSYERTRQKVNNKSSNIDDDFFNDDNNGTTTNKKQEVDDDDFFNNNDWDNEDDNHQHVKSKQNNNNTNSNNRNNNRTHNYENNSRYAGVSSTPYEVPKTNINNNNADKYKGIGPKGYVNNNNNRGLNSLSNLSLSDLNTSDMAWYLTEQAKDQYQNIAQKTKEVSSYLGDQFQVVSQNMTDWFSQMMEGSDKK
ncbi:hypothetical protein ABK040_005431 [Willaertia magna]